MAMATALSQNGQSTSRLTDDGQNNVFAKICRIISDENLSINTQPALINRQFNRLKATPTSEPVFSVSPNAGNDISQSVQNPVIDQRLTDTAQNDGSLAAMQSHPRLDWILALETRLLLNKKLY
jgi:hypothetical protein